MGHHLFMLHRLKDDLNQMSVFFNSLSDSLLFWNRWQDLQDLAKHAKLRSSFRWESKHEDFYVKLRTAVLNCIGLANCINATTPSISSIAQETFLLIKVHYNKSKATEQTRQKEQKSVLPWEIQPVNALKVKWMLQEQSKHNQNRKQQKNVNQMTSNEKQIEQRQQIKVLINRDDEKKTDLIVNHNLNFWEAAKQTNVSYDGVHITIL